MSAEAQRALGERLASHRFDVALDLATSHVSRPLLKLAGARFTMGFDETSFPWLTGGISGRIRAPHEGSEASPHAGRVLALVERLATLTGTAASVLRRPDLDRTALSKFEIGPRGALCRPAHGRAHPVQPVAPLPRTGRGAARADGNDRPRHG